MHTYIYIHMFKLSSFSSSSTFKAFAFTTTRFSRSLRLSFACSFTSLPLKHRAFSTTLFGLWLLFFICPPAKKALLCLYVKWWYIYELDYSNWYELANITHHYKMDWRDCVMCMSDKIPREMMEYAPYGKRNVHMSTNAER